jgi:hypothetical protein
MLAKHSHCQSSKRIIVQSSLAVRACAGAESTGEQASIGFGAGRLISVPDNKQERKSERKSGTGQDRSDISKLGCSLSASSCSDGQRRASCRRAVLGRPVGGYADSNLECFAIRFCHSG